MNDQHFQVHQIASTVRFIQGYRFLDKCGEAMVLLEGALDEGWIPRETTPKAGVMVNHQLGMNLEVNSSRMSVSQDEFIDFSYFRDQVCKIYDVIHRTFEIKTVNAPTLQVTYQRGFDDVASAETCIEALGLCPPSPLVIQALGGHRSALSFTVCCEEDITWRHTGVQLRTRLDVRSVRQERQPRFDERLMQRTRLLPKLQREAMLALARLREQHPGISPVAAQIELEYAHETEINTREFDLPQFYSDAWVWQEGTVRQLLQQGGT